MSSILAFAPGDFAHPTDLVMRDALRAMTARLPRVVESREIGLLDFAKEAWQVIEPSTPYVDGWHITAICEHLEAVTRGEIKQLVISMPPRHMKSILVAVMWPCWVWTRNPGFRWIFASYAQSLAVRDSVKCRTIIQSPWFRKHWGEVFDLKSDENQKTKFVNSAEGYRIATSVDGSATGEGGDCIVGDDLIKAKDAYSEPARTSAVTFWRETMHTRINDPRKVKKVLMAQRIHEGDPSGVMLETGSYVHLCLPAEYDPRSTVPVGAPNPLAFTDPRTETGDLLWPDRYGSDVIEATKKALGPWAYAAQFQQSPTPATGGIFKREWLRFHTRATVPKAFDEVFQSWDMSFKRTEDGSYVVGQVWGKAGASFYLLDQIRGRFDFVESKAAVLSLCERWPDAFAKYIEEKANGAAIMSALANEVIGLIPVLPHGTKEARAHAIAPAVQSGNVFFPDAEDYGFAWVADLIAEVTAFPRAPNDDQVDAMTQALAAYITDPLQAMRLN